MRNSSGIVRGVRKLNSTLTSVSKKSENKNDDRSLKISALSLVISIISIYIQFFYKNHDLKASLINSDVVNDSIIIDLIYQNKGNQDATIISSEIFFFSDKNKDIEDSHIQFINKENDNLPPFILSPGKQIFYKFKQKVYFDEDNLLLKNRTRNQDTLRVNLRINYITANSMQTEDTLKCGWITLDSSNKIKNWSIDYQSIDLNSDIYFSKAYNYEKNK